MKKWLVGFLKISLFLLITCLYFFIPSKLSVTKITAVSCSLNGTYRILSNSINWKMWWPSGDSNSVSFQKPDSFFAYKNCKYRITKKLYNSVEISIQYKKDTPFKSIINIISMAPDSMALEWSYTTKSGQNPLSRVEQYNKALKIKRSMAEIMRSLKSFLEKPENIYGIKINMLSTTDSFLVATKSIYPHYPSTSDIYGLINNLKNHISNQNAIVTGFPIMNIKQIDSLKFRLMVAVPTNKIANDTGNFFYMRMIPGHFMSTKIKGGIYNVNRAFSQLQLYVSDYKKISMAIPFESLITDRSKIIDSAKWVTEIYFPVM